MMIRIKTPLIVLTWILSSANLAFAGVIGVTVDGIGSHTEVGSTADRPLLEGLDLVDGVSDGIAVEYYIPLVDNADIPGLGAGNACTYGVSYGSGNDTYACGTASDSGDGGALMSMFIKFDPVSTTETTFLEVLFEDLDLADANDPVGFLETLQVFNGIGNSLTGLITDISSSFVDGNKDTQQLLSLNLGVLGSTPLWLEMQFSANFDRNGRNTPEYLIAAVTSVPEPSSLLLFLVGLFLIPVARRRRHTLAGCFTPAISTFEESPVLAK
jgi:PEP-CTERM motif